jgi:Transcriptional Coactivator p15 (PC4)
MDLYSKVIEENMDKGYQVRLAASEFRETVYLHLRKYFLSYEGEWIASKEGVSVPASIENVYALLDGLFDICAKAEGYEIIRKYAEKLIDNSSIE